MWAVKPAGSRKPLSQTGLQQPWEGVWDRGGLWGAFLSNGNVLCMDAPGKGGTPPFAQVTSRYPTVPEVLSFTNTSFFFFVPKISFWLCWQSFLLDLQHIQRVRAVYSCATTSPTFPSEAQHTSTSSVCFLLSTSRVFVLFRASFLAELPPCWGWLMLGAGSGFYTLPSSSGTCPGGWQLARCASLGFGEGEGTGWECLSFLPAPLGQPGELRSSRDRQKSSFVLRSQV